jgi:UDP-N-acetylmuramoylalanine--D-glutamate ligase
VLRFGLGAPQAPGDYGLVEDGGIAWLVRARPDEDGPRRRGAIGAAGAADPGPLQLQRLMPADALRVRGRHNAANALAALALAGAIGCPLAPMLHGLREYAGEPHRLQWVGTVGGVDAYDDSKGTNVGATVAALAGLGADRGPRRLVVILGGDGKGQDFAPLAAPLARWAHAVATIGRDAPAIEAALAAGWAAADGMAGADAPALQRHATLPEATAWAFARARPGDAVLLSPACASLDMFSGYAERAAVFVAAVQERAAERGEVAA